MAYYCYPGSFSSADRKKAPEPHTATTEYEPLNIEFVGRQKLTFTAPPLQWRNNLVALSQRYNYLFVAVRDQILVYQPELPSQQISRDPVVLKSTSSSGFPGYINPQCPHGINSLTVGNLGHEEVLVSAHDNGDICLYYTADLTRIALRFSVGMSAWGVSLHQQSRRLAVSSNSKLIHVFELAVSKQVKDSTRKDSSSKNSNGLPHTSGLVDEPSDPEAGVTAVLFGENIASIGSTRPGRGYSVAINTSSGFYESRPLAAGTGLRWRIPVKVLQGHTHNIPNIAFLDDESGNWLMGTAIDGQTILWDVNAESKLEASGLPHSERGWSVALLRPEYFLPTQHVKEGFGVARGECINTVVRHTKNGKKQYDITPRTDHGHYFQASSTPRRGYYTDEDDESDEDDDDDDDGDIGLTQEMQDIVQILRSQGSEWEIDGEEEIEEEENEHDQLWQHEEPWLHAADVDMMEDDSGDDEDHDETHHENENSSGFSITPQDMLDYQMSDPTAPHHEEHDDDDGDDDHHAFPLISAREVERVARSQREWLTSFVARLASATQKPKKAPAKPIIMPSALLFSTSEHNVRLFHSLNDDAIVHCNLYNRQIPHLEPIDRLNMILVIPELSTVVTATQKGKAMIFRLTQTRSHGYMMRLDDVLPREKVDWSSVRNKVPVSEAEDGIRPDDMLLGIAVGPLQGRQFPDESQKWKGNDEGNEQWRRTEIRRRYRLMMVYMSGVVLSYELGAPRPWEWLMV